MPELLTLEARLQHLPVLSAGTSAHSVQLLGLQRSTPLSLQFLGLIPGLAADSFGDLPPSTSISSDCHWESNAYQKEDWNLNNPR